MMSMNAKPKCPCAGMENTTEECSCIEEGITKRSDRRLGGPVGPQRSARDVECGIGASE